MLENSSVDLLAFHDSAMLREFYQTYLVLMTYLIFDNIALAEMYLMRLSALSFRS